MSFIINFVKRYKFKEIFSLLREEYLEFFLRNLPSYEGMLLRRFFYKLIFRKIGTNALFWPNVYVTHGYNISIGSHFAVNYGSHLDGRGEIELGDFVLIGPNVFIGSSNHVIESDLSNPRYFLGHIPKKTVIGSNVWIGANSVICPGVRIGDNSIIGAGSVVIKDIPDSVIVAGNPAEVKRPLD